MRPVRVLLLTFRGPHGQVDAAVRDDVTMADVVPVVAAIIGTDPTTAQATVERDAAGHRHLALGTTLEDLGLVDGDIVNVGFEPTHGSKEHPMPQAGTRTSKALTFDVGGPQ